MKTRIDIIKNCFIDNKGILRFPQFRQYGFHPRDIHDCMKNGKIEKIGRGLYRLTDYPLNSYPDYVMTSLQIPKGVICLLSALYFHKATNEIPRFVDIAIQSKNRANKITYPPVKFYRFSPVTWASGIEEHDIDGQKVKIYSLAKTIADCVKFRNIIGMDVVREAVRVAITEKNIKPTEIANYAKICRVERVIKPVLEATI